VHAWCIFLNDTGHDFCNRYQMASVGPRRTRPRQCPTRGEFGVAADFGAFSVDVSCTHCGQVISSAEQDEYVSWAEMGPAQPISLACDRGRHAQPFPKVCNEPG
jgi:hypothetical protein